MDFILFILFIAYFSYNIIQVNKASKGLRIEPMPLLFFFASAMDLVKLISNKLKRH